MICHYSCPFVGICFGKSILQEHSGVSKHTLVGWGDVQAACIKLQRFSLRLSFEASEAGADNNSPQRELWVAVGLEK
jgi:hypothetical protein